MKRAMVSGLSAAALAAWFLAPWEARASSPDLDVAELSPGERSAEVNAFIGDNGWSVRPELEFGLSDRLALEFQADVVDAPGAKAELVDVSAQVMLSLSPDGRVGVAAELGYAPDEKETGGEVFMFASRDVGAWSVDLNLGVQREDDSTAAVYAWRLERDVTANWSAGVEGGGEAPFRGDEHEHLAGPTVAARFSSAELRLGWLFASAGENLARIGLEREF